MAKEQTGIDLTKYPIPRVRHHVSPQVYLPAEQHHIIPPWYPPSIEISDWNSFFSKGAAQVLDIGCGRGGFLLKHSLDHPEINILGLEVRDILVSWVNGVIGGESIPNARSVWYTVANGLRWVPAGAIEYAFYLFPDPWPKTRHHKRRLFSKGFLDEIDHVLKPGGRLYLATDRPDVDEYQRKVIKKHGLFEIHEVVEPEDWPFDFTTDQQQFCDRKSIPYVKYYISR